MHGNWCDVIISFQSCEKPEVGHFWDQEYGRLYYKKYLTSEQDALGLLNCFCHETVIAYVCEKAQHTWLVTKSLSCWWILWLKAWYPDTPEAI